MAFWATQLPDRPGDGALHERASTGDHSGHVVHERLPHAVPALASPDTLRPHDPHPHRAGYIVQHATATPPVDHDASTHQTPDRRGQCEYSHDLRTVAAIDVLDMDTIETAQQITASTWTVGQASRSARRSRANHVEFLRVNQ